jgi:hypothetical protein
MRLAFYLVAQNSIRFQQVFSAFELDLPDQTALSRTVRPGKNRQNRHASGRRLIQLADHAVVAFTGSAGDEAHLEFTAIRLFHNIDVPLPVPIENRNNRRPWRRKRFELR